MRVREPSSSRLFRTKSFAIGTPATTSVTRGALLFWAVLMAVGAAAAHGVGVMSPPPRPGLLTALLAGGAVVQLVSALVVVAIPTRRYFVGAMLVEAAALLLWFFARGTGLPIGATTWRPETLGVQDLFLPAMEGVSAFFLLCLLGRTWVTAPRGLRIVVRALPFVFVVGLLILAGLHSALTTIVLVVFVFTTGFPTSVEALFVPAVALLAALMLLRLVFPRLRTLTPGAGRTSLASLPALLLVSLLTWGSSATAADRGWFPMSATVSAPAGQTSTLAYCSPGGSPLALDLTEPAAGATRPAPVAIYIHGGEGLVGDRVLTGSEAPYLMRLRSDLVSRGFVVGSLDYRLAPGFKITNEVEDAKCAMRFLRANAVRLGIDPGRIGVYGDSEGGYLTAMLGTTGPQAGFDVGQYLDQSSRIEAGVDMWGPTDLTNFSGSPSWISAIGAGLSDRNLKLFQARAISPLNDVAPGDPPFLIIHGTADWFIAPHHSQDFAQRLKAAGVPETLVMVQNGGHGLDAAPTGEVQQPGPNALVQMMARFFVQTLGS